MAKIVTQGAMIRCNYSPAPGTLMVIPTGPPMVTAGAPIATVMDGKPMMNILPMGTCSSPTNPATKNPSGTAPCTPATIPPWTPPSTIATHKGQPVLKDDAKLTCTLGTPMCISVMMPGGNMLTDVKR